ncbi:hypothetical protein [Microvirgula aerodenitrificans]|uniref:hypothetical protein n=1 Tax=Microvirgula aerodenitrificans TaxID=57480 RepID=UPI0028F094D6|nr:hypothetical protein [Microvirgula aerodenitrificans]
MLIKFNDTDPRAGMVVRMDSSRGQQLIDSGAAEQMAENFSSAKPSPNDGVKTDVVDAQDDGDPADQLADASSKKSGRARK